MPQSKRQLSLIARHHPLLFSFPGCTLLSPSSSASLPLPTVPILALVLRKPAFALRLVSFSPVLPFPSFAFVPIALALLAPPLPFRLHAVLALQVRLFVLKVCQLPPHVQDLLLEVGNRTRASDDMWLLFQGGIFFIQEAEHNSGAPSPAGPA